MTIFLFAFQWILHNWSDDDCAKILTNCRKAIPKETGRVIIVEIVQQPKEDDAFRDTRFILDLSMLDYFSSGKERQEKEWGGARVRPRTAAYSGSDLTSSECAPVFQLCCCYVLLGVRVQ